jgi:hypothetical protein
MAKVVVAVNVAFLAAVVAVALLALHGGARLFAVGLLCAALTVGMYAAPLGAMVSMLCYAMPTVSSPSHSRTSLPSAKQSITRSGRSSGNKT